MSLSKRSAVVLLLLLTACHTTRKAASTGPVSLNTLRVSANNNASQLFRAAAPRTWELVNTRVELQFNLTDKTADGREWIELKPHFKDTTLIVLDAKSMKIDSVGLVLDDVMSPQNPSRARCTLLPHTYDGKELRVILPNSHSNSASGVKLFISYKAMPYADSTIGGSSAITEDRGLYFINTDHAIPNKPVQIWTQGETESNSHWLPTIDKPNQRTRFEMELTVPDSMETLSNGYKTGTSSSGNGLRTDTWSMDKPIQPYAIMFAIGSFSMVHDEHKGVPVDYYVEPKYKDAATAIFNHTPQMIDYFSDVTGQPYPWNKYSQVVVRDYVSGAMENTSASLFGEFMNGNRREIADNMGNEDVVSHELFHQWFGDYVTAESWSNITLNESFATYGEVLWRQHSQGLSRANELAWDELGRYIATTPQKDPALVRYYYHDKEDVFDRISYQKGGAVLRYMNGLMGDEAFSKAMHLYLSKNALQPAEVSQWRLAIEEATGQDWMLFFNEWYFRAGHPELNVRYNYDDAAKMLTVNVTQQSSPDTASLYHLPLKAGIMENGKIRIIDWNVDRRSQTFSFAYTGGKRPLFIPDFYHWLPGIIRENKTVDEDEQQLRLSQDYNTKRRALQHAAYGTGNTNTSNAALYLAALNDSIAGIRFYALQLLLTEGRESLKDALARQCEYLATQDAYPRIRAAAFNVLAAWKGAGLANLPGEAKEAINSESYAVGAAALQTQAVLQPDTAYYTAKSLLGTDPHGQLETAVWDVIARRGNAADMAIMAQRANEFYGNKRIAFSNSIFFYAIATKDDGAFHTSVELLANMASQDNIRNYRFSIGSLIYNLEGYYKHAKGRKEIEIATRRLIIIRDAEQQLIKAEKDDSNLEQYRIIQARL